MAALPGSRRSNRFGQRGQGLVEYGLILVIVSVTVIAILAIEGAQVKNLLYNVACGLGVVCP